MDKGGICEQKEGVDWDKAVKHHQGTTAREGMLKQVSRWIVEYVFRWSDIRPFWDYTVDRLIPPCFHTGGPHLYLY